MTAIYIPNISNGVLSPKNRPPASWPETCRFYDPATMSPEAINRILRDETEYANDSKKVSCIMMSQGQCVFHTSENDDNHKDSFLRISRPRGSTTVLYLRHQRLIYRNRTVSDLALDSATWLKLLDHFQVVPNFLEILHSNIGGNCCYVNYGKGRDDDDNAVAFHVAYKIGGWGSHESAVYAQHDIENGTNFILVTGLLTGCLERMQSLYERAPQATIFHALLELASLEQDVVERVRWRRDLDTIFLEAKTGFSTFRVAGVQPLSVEQLGFDGNGYVTLDGLRDVGWGSATFRTSIRALLGHFDQYINIGDQHGNKLLSARTISSLRSAYAQKIELAESQHAQIQQLRLRVLSQLDVTRTLITQRDMQLNIEIASAAKEDSKRMHIITLITMVFLPATFLATFFSMVFFNIERKGSLDLTVDQSFWLYPTVALPFTFCTLFSYFFWSSGRTLFASFRGSRRPPDEKEDAAVESARAAFFARHTCNDLLNSDRPRSPDFACTYGWHAQ